MGRTADAIAEGVAIAYAAARLTLRNRILVDAIANDATFDLERLAVQARETLRALADEQDAAADLAKRLRRRAGGNYSDSDGTHDYRERDTRNLRRRERLYRGVANALRKRADDRDDMTALIEQARDAAWHDVEANLQRRLAVEGMRPELDPDYAMMRAARMQSIRLIDLARLRAHRRAPSPGT